MVSKDEQTTVHKIYSPNEFMYPIDSGIWPVILLLPSQSVLKFDNSEICSGNEPVKSLLLAANSSAENHKNIRTDIQ
jgi:hypothetical protein